MGTCPVPFLFSNYLNTDTMTDKTDEKKAKTKAGKMVKVRIVNLPFGKRGQTIEAPEADAKRWLAKGQVTKA